MRVLQVKYISLSLRNKNHIMMEIFSNIFSKFFHQNISFLQKVIFSFVDKSITLNSKELIMWIYFLQKSLLDTYHQ